MTDIKIYTKSHCPYCTSAKAILDKLGAKYEEIDITDSPEIMTDLVQKSGMMTVPQIFVGDKFLGGSDDIRALHDAGILKAELGLE